jgi:cephalosporin-C deacetylase-like acetyl esterase
MRFRPHRAGFFLLLLSLSAVASAQQPASKLELTLRTDRPEALYAPQETAEFLIQVRQDGARLAGGTVSVELTNDGFKPVGPARTLTLDDQGRAALSSTLPDPGFLQCRVTVKNGDQSTSGLVAAGFSPEKIVPAAKLPADFDSFWGESKQELSGIPLDAKLTPVERPNEPDVSVYKINLANVDKTRVYGWLSVPKKPGLHPAVLGVPGAGVYPQGPSTQFARLGALSLNISVHDMDVDLPASAYAEANAGTLKGYPHQGKSDRDKFYYRRVVLGCVRALDYLTSRTDWDSRHLAVVGSSQGGALSLITGGVDRRVTAISANVPAMCDHPGYTIDRVSGWPQLGEQGNAAAKDAITRTSAYYDAVNFARAFRGPALVGVGFIDRTCPPTSVYAAYNVLRGTKEIVTSPLMGHAVDPRFSRRQEAFLQDHWAH